MSISKIDTERLSNSIQIGLDFIKAHKIKSPWNTNGKGWQERVVDSPIAGFYASCDALELLHLIEGKWEDSLIKEVVENHLLVPFKEKSREINSKQDISKVKAYTQLLKLSKILRLCQFKELYDKYESYFIEIGDLIIKSCIDETGWDYVIHSEEEKGSIKISPTIEVLMALNIYSVRQPQNIELNKILRNGTKYAKEILLNEKSRIHHRILALNMLTKANLLKSISREKIVEIISQIIKANIPYETLVDERFLNSYTQDEDFYHFHLGNIFNETIYLLCLKKIIPADLILSCLTNANTIIELYETKGYFLSNTENNIYFWENYYALKVLLVLRELFDFLFKHDKKHFYMIVNQRHFKAINPLVENDLCTIVMPFEEEWSKDMFDFYKELLGENKFRIWRSDMEVRDDEVIHTVWAKIVNSKFIIADCTSKNANVLYELGLAHALGKPVLITTQNKDDIPYDLKRIRFYRYNTRSSGLKILSEVINNFIKTI